MVTFETKQTEFSTSEKGTWFFAFGKKLAYPSNFTEILFTNNTRNSNRTCQVFHCSKNVPLSIAEDSSLLVLIEGTTESLLPTTTNQAKAILESYKESEEALINNITGNFTIIIYDKRKDTLLAIRDPLGKQPLFYAQEAGTYLFSPSIDVLLSLPNISKTLNRTLLAERLCDIWTSFDETYYKTIKKIQASHYLKIQENDTKLLPYWLAAKDFTKIDWVEENGLELFENLFEKTLTNQLVKGQSGIFLSGGLDSVSVAVMATDITQKKNMPTPLTLSLFFSHPDCNEKEIQQGVSKQLGLANKGLDFDDSVGQEGWFFSALNLSQKLSAPLTNFWWPAYMNLAIKGKEQGCKVILTGGGGDEWLSVTPYLAVDLLYTLDFKGLYNLWNTIFSSYKISPLMNLKFLLWNCGLRLIIGNLARKALLSTHSKTLYQIRKKRKEKILADWLLKDPSLKKEVYERWEAAENYKDIKNYYLNEMLLSLKHPLISLEMEENYQIEKFLGLDVYQSYWNSELIELLYRVSPNLLTKGGKSKGLVRDLVASKFPGLGFEKQKKVLSTNYFSILVSKQLKHVWQKLAKPSALIELGIIDQSKLNFSNALPNSGLKNPSFLAWEMANLEVWVKSHH